MTSTFMGLEIAKRGMMTQQNALYVTSQNVANASTDGYSRQRVNFEATEAYPFPGMNREQIPGQMGTGVKAGSIQRVRESFLDVQYRTENNKVGYWQAKSDSLSQLENIMNEPSDSGLSNTMDQFWQSLQDLAVDPTNSGARSVVLQRGQAVTDTFNYLSNSLTAIQKDQKDQIDVTATSINSILDQLNGVNQQIGRVEPNGMLPNDLYDERDRLIDQLSSLVNIKVIPSTAKISGTPDPKAEGQLTIDLVDDNGKSLGTILSATGPNKLQVNYDTTKNDAVNTVTIGSGTPIAFSTMNSSGKLSGLIQSYGYVDGNSKVTGSYPDMLNNLDKLAYTFATKFNEVHKSGTSPYEMTNGNQNIAFFAEGNGTDISSTVSTVAGFASRISVSTDIQGDLNKIATATSTNIGDSSNATNLANIINNSYEYDNYGDAAGTSPTTDFRSYYQNIIGAMGVNSQGASQMAKNSTSLQQAVDERRKSVSSVSLDEEMTNMIQFQHAYSASAKMITVQNDLLDTIINGMGVGK